MAELVSTFKVTVVYREPTYELVHGAKHDPYFWEYTIVARSPVEAQRAATAEFDEMARLSSVGWVRCIVRVDVELLRATGT